MHEDESLTHQGEPRDLARTLQGVLPCTRCGYELKGLSIRAACPECGLAVRATLLAAVDPAAEELQPLHRPRILVVGLMAWSVGALASGLAVLAMRVIDLAGAGADAWMARLSYGAVAGLAASWLGSLVLVRPHAGTPQTNIARGVLGAAAYALVLGAAAWLLLRYDPSLIDRPYTDPEVVYPLRSQVRLGLGAALLVMLISLRPNARMLAARSLVLRTGRVDRQPMNALAAAVGVAICGDLIQLASIGMTGVSRDVVWAIGAGLIAVGSLLLLVGVVGIVIDCYRVSRVLLEPSPSLRDVIGPPRPGNGDDA